MAPTIALSEFARRLCIARHPHVGTTGVAVPCGAHVVEAQRLWGLLTEDGTLTLDVILGVRVEDGIAAPADMRALADEVERLRLLVDQGIEAFRLTREYYDDELLPAVPGWEWFDWTEKAEAELRKSAAQDLAYGEDGSVVGRVLGYVQRSDGRTMPVIAANHE